MYLIRFFFVLSIATPEKLSRKKMRSESGGRDIVTVLRACTVRLL